MHHIEPDWLLAFNCTTLFFCRNSQQATIKRLVLVLPSSTVIEQSNCSHATGSRLLGCQNQQFSPCQEVATQVYSTNVKTSGHIPLCKGQCLFVKANYFFLAAAAGQSFNILCFWSLSALSSCWSRCDGGARELPVQLHRLLPEDPVHLVCTAGRHSCHHHRWVDCLDAARLDLLSHYLRH